MRRVGGLLLLLSLWIMRGVSAQTPQVITSDNASQLSATSLVSGFNASQLAMHPDGSQIALLTNQSDTQIIRLALNSFEILEPLDGAYPIIHLAYGGDGRLYTTHADGVARIWSDTTLQALFRHTGELRSITADFQGNTFVTSATPIWHLQPQDAVIRLWDARNEEPFWLDVVDTTVVTAFAFSPDGSLVVSGGSGYSLHEYEALPLHIWNTSDGDLVALLQGHPDNIIRIAFSPDGSLLATGSVDGTILFWDVNAITQEGITAPLKTFHLTSDIENDEVYLTTFHFSPTGDLFVTAQGSLFNLESLHFWRLSDLLMEDAPAPVAIHEQEYGVRDFAFTPDGTKIITISDYEPDQGVWLWQVE